MLICLLVCVPCSECLWTFGCFGVSQSACPSATRVSLACNSGAIGDQKHMIFEWAALAPLRQQQADLFTPCTDTMRSFFAQQDLLGVHEYMTPLP